MGGGGAANDAGAGLVGPWTFTPGVILCTLRGYSDPEGEFETGEIVCAIERSEDGYRLLLEYNRIHLHESHGRIDTARGKGRCSWRRSSKRAGPNHLPGGARS